MIKTVLFDADGVLLKNETYFSERYVQEFGVDPEVVHNFFRNEWYEIVTGQADLKQVLVQYMEDWQWHKSVDELLEYWFVAEDYIDIRVIDSILQLNNVGMDCCLATNQEKYRLDYMSQKMKFSDLFKTLYASCNLGVKKPNHEYYKLIWEDLGRPNKRSILFWDDTRDNVLNAREFGISAELYTNFDQYLLKMKDKYQLL